MAVADAPIASAMAWVETLPELEQLPAYSGEHFLDLAQVDLRPSAGAWYDDGGDGSVVFRR